MGFCSVALRFMGVHSCERVLGRSQYIPVMREPWKSALTSLGCIAAALGTAWEVNWVIGVAGAGARARSSDI